MITKQQAISATYFTHLLLKNADKTPLRVRRSGMTVTWKTRPEDFSVPVKYGMHQSLRITPANAAKWQVAD